MKKFISALLGSVLILSSAATSVFAYAKNPNSYVDSDDDGVCDNSYEVLSVSSQDKDIAVFSNKDENTVSDIITTASSNGGQNRGNANFVDEDGDGICDNRTDNCPKNGQGKYRRNSHCGTGRSGGKHCAGK